MEYIHRIADRVMAIQAQDAALVLGAIGAAIVAVARCQGLLA